MDKKRSSEKTSPKADRPKRSILSLSKNLVVILGIITTIFGLGPQLLDSLDKLAGVKQRYALFSKYVSHGHDLFNEEHFNEAARSFQEALTLRPYDFEV